MNEVLLERKVPVVCSYDVVVAGGGPAGIAAAVSAAKEGARVLLVEKAGVVGGCLTIGHVSPISGDYGENTMADKINLLLKKGVKKAALVHDFEYAKSALTELLAVSGVDVYLNAAVADVTLDGDKIKSLVLATQQGLQAVEGKMFVDATGDGLVSFLAGEEIMQGREDGLTQPVSVMFTIDGLDENQDLFCINEVQDKKLKKGYYQSLCRNAEKSGELPKNVSVVRLYNPVSKSERLVNASQANGIDGTSPADYARAQIELRRQQEQILAFLQNNVEGFENAKIKDSSDGVGVRETRRVKGLYVIHSEDLMRGKRHEDVVVHKASFAIDIHNPSGGGQSVGDGLPEIPGLYDIPYRALVPLKTQNLYVAGRCISGTHRAHASYRVMNICMNMGEAVGIGSALCVKQEKTPATLSVKEVQEVLTKRGISLFD